MSGAWITPPFNCPKKLESALQLIHILQTFRFISEVTPRTWQDLALTWAWALGCAAAIFDICSVTTVLALFNFILNNLSSHRSTPGKDVGTVNVGTVLLPQYPSLSGFWGLPEQACHLLIVNCGFEGSGKHWAKISGNGLGWKELTAHPGPGWATSHSPGCQRDGKHEKGGKTSWFNLSLVRPSFSICRCVN